MISMPDYKVTDHNLSNAKIDIINDKDPSRRSIF